MFKFTVSVSFPEVKEPLLAAMMLGESQQTSEQKTSYSHTERVWRRVKGLMLW